MSKVCSDPDWKASRLGGRYDLYFAMRLLNTRRCMMTRFNMFTDDELNAMESAFCNERLGFLVDEIRRERNYREMQKYRMADESED